MVAPNPVNVAIVGISAELPSGTHSDHNLNHKEFFQFLLNGLESYEPIPGYRFNAEAWQGTGLGHISVKKASFLKHIDLFDNVEFGISSKDAAAMAPATRKLIENSFLALLDSGIDYRVKRVGCYTSGNVFDITNTGPDVDEYDQRGSFAGAPCQISNRISNHLDLLGPSLPIDTACSSSLTAFHLALQGIASGDCDAAVVGGAQIDHRFTDWINYSQGSLLAPDGKCKPFDASADGFARAEACIVVVLKPLADALRDHDFIYGTVLASAINSTGGAAPPAAPVAESQKEAMLQAFARAGCSPKEVDFAELHATGTAKGDPTEVNWVGEQFHREQELLVGSVKGNIGHTEIVSFLACLSKVLSIIETNTIPPAVNITRLNPAIKWKEYNIRVPVQPEPLPNVSGGRKLFALFGSGIGGSNGHVVLQGPPSPSAIGFEPPLAEGSYLMLASGLSPRTASATADSVNEVLEKDTDRSVLSTVLGRRGKQMTWRSYAIVNPNAPGPLKFPSPVHCPRIPNPVVFVFSGQGPQHKEMGRQLFERFPIFRQSILEMDGIFKSLTNTSMIDDYGLFGKSSSKKALPNPWSISLILPSIAIFQIALYDLFIYLGMKPDLLIGHSAGETAALYASGAGSKVMAVELAVIRGTSFAAMESLGGTMAAVSCPSHIANEIIATVHKELPGRILEIACFNSPSAVAVAGHTDAIDCMVSIAESRGIFARKIQTRVPIHSSMMEAVRAEYSTKLEELFERHPGPHTPKIPTYSTLTGSLFSGTYHPGYFWKTTRYAVKFAPAIEEMVSSRQLTFVELAPHPVLASYLSSMANDGCTVAHSVRRPKTGTPSAEYHDILDLCGKLMVAGHNMIDFTALTGGTCYDAKIELPPYPFAKKQYPLFPKTAGTIKQFEGRLGPLNHKYLKVNKETHPTLAEHVIRGEPIMPAAGYIEMALEFGATTLLGVNMVSMLTLSSEDPVKVEVELDGSHWSVKSLLPSKSSAADKPLTFTERLHADGYLSFEPPHAVKDMDIRAVRSRMKIHMGPEFYDTLGYFSTYGPKFQRVTNFWYGNNEALVSIRGMDDVLAADGDYILHPAILDACFHATAYKHFHGNFDPNIYHLPAGIEAVILHQPAKPKYFPSHIYAYVHINEWRPDSMTYDIVLLSPTGQHLLTLRNFKVDKHYMSKPEPIANAFQVVLQHASPLRQPEADADLVVEPHVITGHADFTSLNVDAKVQCKCLLEDAVNSLCSTLEVSVSRFTCRDQRRVVRLFVYSSVASAFPILEKSIARLPHIFFELFVAESDTKQVISIPASSGTVRSFDPNAKYEDLRAVGVVDMAVALHISTDSNQFAAIARCYSELLCPGGTLIVTDHRCRDVPSNVAQLARQMHLLGDLTALTNSNFAVVEGGDKATSTHATFECQKRAPPTQLFKPTTALVHEYKIGKEAELHSLLTQLDGEASQEIWILAQEGRAAGAAAGLTRALRKEYLFWTIKFIVYPPNQTSEQCLDSIKSIPDSMVEEDEIYFSANGELLVSRVVPLPNHEVVKSNAVFDDQRKNLDWDHVLLNICSFAPHGKFIAFTAIITSSVTAEFPAGSFVAGLLPMLPRESKPIHVSTLSLVPHAAVQNNWASSCDVAGYAVGALALGAMGFTRSRHNQSLRILLTHSDTPIGESVARLYQHSGIDVVVAPIYSQTVDLVKLGFGGKFDIIISGFDDRARVQVLQTLLRTESGRLFLWNDSSTGVSSFVHSNPWAIGDALSEAFKVIGKSPALREPTIVDFSLPDEVKVQPPPVLKHAQFYPNKCYVVLGGVGSLGAQIALLMYQRGAKHVILTSRSGEKGLADPKNHMVQHIVSYLRRENMDIKLEAVDATSPTKMKAFFDRLPQELGGCMILTAVLRDRSFQYLDQESFDVVFKAKIGVMDVLRSVIDISSLDFLIAFSSVAGTFAGGGQTNYSAANTVMESEFANISNGFAFICPGVIDSTLMHAGEADAGTRFAGIMDWSMTAEETMAWLDDAIYRLQNGQRFARYCPQLNWDGINKLAPLPKLAGHLVSSSSESEDGESDGGDKIAEIVRRVLNIAAEDLSPQVPFTSYGIDSLSASKLSFLLRSHVVVSQFQLLADICLDDLHRLAETNAPTAESTAVTSFASAGPVSRAQAMESMLEKYTLDLAVAEEKEFDRVVFLTGSTGALGCNILAKLLKSRRVRRVYAFNRWDRNGLSLVSRQTDAFETHGFPVSLVTSTKLVLLEGDLTAPNFGLVPRLYTELLTNVTHIIHNAWAVDFFTELVGFEPLVLGTRRLIDFATQSKLPAQPTISFISSVGVFQELETSDVPSGPEAPILDAKMAARNGYVESKWVSERMLQIASEKLGLKTNIIRVGLLAGGVNGCWDVDHYIPALAQSGAYLGCLPEGNDTVSWLPVDTAASAIIDMQDSFGETFHCVHPNPVDWMSIMTPLAEELNVPLVPYEEWCARLTVATKHDTATMDIEGQKVQKAAFRVLDIFQIGLLNPQKYESMGLLPKVDMKRSKEASKTLKDPDLPKLGKTDVKKWVSYWRQVGFLPSP